MLQHALALRRGGALAAAIVAALVAAGCVTPATEVLVGLGTDAPAERGLVLTLEARAASGEPVTRVLERDAAAPGAVVLPGSFAVAPPPGAPRDGLVTLAVTATFAPTASDPMRTVRRVARFRYVPRVHTYLPLFLPLACANAARGCTSVPDAACTISTWCDDRGLTCGDRGTCVSQLVAPAPLPDAAVSPAEDVPQPFDDASVCPPGTASGPTGCAPLDAPRPVAPLSTATVRRQRPRLRWALPAGADGARLELCRNRGMASGCLAPLDLAGSDGTPDVDLAPGVWFWRLRARAGGGAGTATSPTWQFNVGSRSAPLDASWGTTPDVNGDGFADVLVGEASASALGGHAYVFLGGAGGVATTPARTLASLDGAGAEFGAAVASAGDVNGDGYSDVVVGSPGALSMAGRAYIYLGGPGGLASTPATTLNGADGTNALFGLTAASAGDVNADGFADVLVGAPQAQSFAGRAYLFLGGPSGLAATPAMALTAPGGASGQFGIALASAGDVNGDGFADAIIAADGEGSAGRAYIFPGRATGLATGASVIALDAPDGAGSAFGGAVASADDVNGDGLADVIVGAFGVMTSTGRAYVYLGRAGMPAATPATTLVAPGGTSGFFGGTVAGAGDVNGDGYSDVIVGARNVNAGAGRAYFYPGSAGGVFAMPAVVLDGPGGSDGQFGTRVAGAGDLTGDGFADVVVSAPAESSVAGRAYVYRGGPTSGFGAAPTALAGSGAMGALFGTSIARVEPRGDGRAGQCSGQPPAPLLSLSRAVASVSIAPRLPLASAAFTSAITLALVRGYATPGFDALSRAATAARSRMRAAPVVPGPPMNSSAPCRVTSPRPYVLAAENTLPTVCVGL